MEAAPGIEPGITVLQTIALPLGYAAIYHSTYFTQSLLIVQPSKTKSRHFFNIVATSE
jgi:hypothetical protein